MSFFDKKSIFLIIYFVSISTLFSAEKKENFINNMFFTYENDSVYGGDDRYYSNGANLFLSTKTFKTSKENKLLSKIFKIENKSYHNYSFGLGQKIFTPNDIEISTPIANDRPYAGYLYSYFNKNIKHNNIMDTFGFVLGVTGDMSLGETVQKKVHKFIKSPTPSGWDNQISNEVLFTLNWTRAIELREVKKYAYDWNFIPKISTNIGTPYTNLDLYFEYRYGWNLETDLTFEKIRANSAGVIRNTKNNNFKDLSYYLFFGAGTNLIAYNTFLDNKKVSNYESNIDMNYITYNFTAGLNLRYQNYYLKYSTIYESKEFKQQKDGQLILSLTAGFLF